jgi:hypothetical protein
MIVPISTASCVSARSGADRRMKVSVTARPTTLTRITASSRSR